MDYENKYKEALGFIEKVYRCSNDPDEKKRIEEIFPELAGSESERIKTFLHHTFTAQYLCKDKLGKWHGEPVVNILTWLEKQGDKKPILDVEIPFGAKDSELEEFTYDIPKGYHAEIEDNKVILRKGEKKSSWSEEDEEIISVLNAYTEVAENDDCPLNAEKIRKAVGKLKSLRPQSQWRPSEEHLDALNNMRFAVQHFGPSASLAALDDLYNQLNKLTE